MTISKEIGNGSDLRRLCIRLHDISIHHDGLCRVLFTAVLCLCVRPEKSQVAVGSGIKQITRALRLNSRGRDEPLDDMI